MQEFKHKNDYTCIVVIKHNGTYDPALSRKMKLTYVHNIVRLAYWLRDKGIDWHHINVYARRSRRFICQVRRDHFIQPYPK